MDARVANALAFQDIPGVPALINVDGWAGLNDGEVAPFELLGHRKITADRLDTPPTRGV
jgi:hypothetical protein